MLYFDKYQGILMLFRGRYGFDRHSWAWIAFRRLRLR